jgi:hypothetical protein
MSCDHGERKQAAPTLRLIRRRPADQAFGDCRVGGSPACSIAAAGVHQGHGRSPLVLIDTSQRRRERG